MLFEQILALIPCAVFWKDKNGVFCGCNQQFLELAGINNIRQLVGKTDQELSWADHWEEYHRDDQHVISSGETITRIEEVSLPHKKIIARTTKTRWQRDQEPAGVLGVIYDVSELVEAKEQAEIANQLKSEFIQNMQHDIRTPASGLCAMLSSLLEEEENPQKKEMLTLLKNSADQLYNICNDVIDFDRAERGDIPVIARKFNIVKLVEDVISLNRTVALSKGLELTFEVDKAIPVILRGDTHRISRVLINLIGNAIKFTSSGKVSLFVKLIKIRKKQIIVQFQLSDTGVGIPSEKINFIYEVFSRGTPSNRSLYKGSGLGLQIVKKFVADLGGEIEVESQLSRGTTFYVNIPFEKSLVDDIHDMEMLAENKTHPMQKTLYSVSHPTNVLVIEDDTLTQMATLHISQKMGLTVHLVDSVKSALEALNQQSFDLVISDIGLPDGLGFDIVKKIKRSPASLNYHTPFIALTAHSDKQKTAEAQQAGFVLMTQKPLMPDKLKLLLDTYVQKNTEPASKPKETLIIDFERTEEMIGEEKMALEMLDLLCANLKQNVDQLKTIQKTTDIKALRELLHKLKGTLSYCSVPRLQEALNQLHEAILEKSSVAQASSLFSRFYEEVDLLLAEYEKRSVQKSK